MSINKELQDLAWRVLPAEFREEVKKEWRHTDSNTTKRTLEYFFGKHNLTSDAEGEEMLTVSRKEVLSIYDNAKEILATTPTDDENKRLALMVKLVLEELFGSKCLPDKSNLSEKITGSEPKPAEPKYHIGQYVRHKPTRLVDVIEGISQSAPYIYHFKHMVNPINGQGIFESDLEPYTKPDTSHETPVCESHSDNTSQKEVNVNGNRNLSQETANCDKQFDTILKDSFAKERRLTIAAMAMQGILSNHVSAKSVMVPGDREISELTLAEKAVKIADALMAEAEKGGMKC